MRQIPDGNPGDHGAAYPCRPADWPTADWPSSESLGVQNDACDTGRVEGADVSVVAADERADANTRLTLDLDQNWHDQQAARKASGDVVTPLDEYVPPRLPRRTEIGSDVREHILHDRAKHDESPERIETYRRLDVRAALGMLHRGPAHTLY
jgi:hypothetical protein